MWSSAGKEIVQEVRLTCRAWRHHTANYFLHPVLIVLADPGNLPTRVARCTRELFLLFDKCTAVGATETSFMVSRMPGPEALELFNDIATINDL